MQERRGARGLSVAVHQRTDVISALAALIVLALVLDACLDVQRFGVRSLRGLGWTAFALLLGGVIASCLVGCVACGGQLVPAPSDASTDADAAIDARPFEPAPDASPPDPMLFGGWPRCPPECTTRGGHGAM